MDGLGAYPRLVRTARAALALLLAVAIPVRAETTTDPLWYLLSTYVLAPDAKAVAAGGEGPADAKGLAALQADLLILSDGFEGFRDEGQIKETLERLKPRMSPELAPFFKDRASSLDAIYRTLAVTDYTWARRFPEPPCAPDESRRKLLAGRDGLFQTAKGEASPWLAALLGPQAEGKFAEQALDQASARAKLSGAEYEKLRARARKLTLALASDKAVGAARARLYCARAAAFSDLAASQREKDSGLLSAARAVGPRPEESVFVVVSKEERAAATLIYSKNGAVLVTDAAIVADTDHPSLFAFSADAKPRELTATVVRRHPELSVAVLAYSENLTPPALRLADKVPEKDDLVTALGHSMVSGLWTKTSGLVTKIGDMSFQTDAVISSELSGGPVLNEAGEVAGLLVLRSADTEEGRWPVAIAAPVLSRWLDDPASSFAAAPATEAIEDAGTAAVLSRAGPSALTLTEAGLGAWSIPNLPPPPPAPNGVCVANCVGSDSPSSNAPYNGPNLWVMLRKLKNLLKPAPKKEVELPDNRPSTKRKTVHTPVQAAPKPPPDPLKPVSLKLSVSRTILAQGEDFEAVATITFKGTEGSIGGRGVTFAGTPGGRIKCSGAKTDGSGVAQATCTALEDGRVTTFDTLDDETRRRRGQKTAGRVRRKVAKDDKIGALKERLADQISALDAEEEKHPDLGNTGSDTPGIDRRLPEADATELEIKGDRVTLGASLDSLNDTAAIDVLERPCPDGEIPAAISTSNRYRCGSKSSGRPNLKDFSNKDEVPAPESEDHSPNEGRGKPAVESRPDDAPTGTKPIDRSGLTHTEIHNIKEGLRAGAKDWVGISPNGDVITADSDGRAINNGHWEDFTQRR